MSNIDIVNIPEDENLDLLPDDITIDRYWEEHNEFINGWDEGTSICLSYRSKYSDKKLVKVIEDFDWYCHVDKQEFASLSTVHKAQVRKYAKKIIPNGKYTKIVCENQSISELYDDDIDDRLRIKSLLDRRGVPVLEGDLKNYKRYCVDKQIKIADNFKIAYLDIETDDREDGIVIGRDRILSFAYYDQDGKSYFHKLEAFNDVEETKLMKKIHKVLMEYDIIVTWNGKNFDIPYIKERFNEMHGYRMSMKTVAHIDFMQRIQKLFQSDVNIRSWSLNFISEYFLGQQKIAHEQGIYEMWEDNPKLLKKYNLMDSKLMYLLEKKLNILALVIRECQWTGTFPSKFYVSELLDNYILRQSNPKGVHFRSTTFNIPKELRKKASDVAGGYVKDPVKGMHDWVHVFDFKSLYPTLMLTFNISQDTFYLEEPEDLENYIKTVNGYWTHRDKRGMVPEVIALLLEARKEYKQKQLDSEYGTKDYEASQGAQQVVKELANSMYGIMAQVGNRYYSKETAEAITLSGQHMNKYASIVLKDQFDYDTLYGDTDSCFVEMPDRHTNKGVKDVLKTVHVEFDKHLKGEYNVKQSYIVLEHEKIFKRIILLQKKQYVGRLIEVDGQATDKIYGRGIEYVKKDTIEYTRELQQKMLKHMLYEDLPVEFYHDFVKKEMKRFDEGDFDVEEIIIRQRVSKKPSKYKVKPVQVRIAEDMIQRNKEFYVGITIPYIVTESKPKLQGVHIDDYGGVYDKKYYWDKRTYHPLKRFLECVFPDEDWHQYEFTLIEKRKKRFEQYSKWLGEKSKAKRKDEYIERIKNEKSEALSPAQRKQLLVQAGVRKPKRFKVASKGDEQCQTVKKNSNLKQKLRKPPKLKVKKS